MTDDINGLVQSLLDQQVAEGAHTGVQVCAYRYGERIVDAWAGQMGPCDVRDVRPDTLFPSFSTTKGVTATLVHMLADQGVLDLEAPVATYWPEFAANGKEGVTVAQALSHQAGLHSMPPAATTETMTDWRAGLDYVAAAKPAWEPGTATGYHAFTFGWVAGGIVEGATGKAFADVLREQIAEPLGVETEMFVGIPEGVEGRLATLAAPRNEGAAGEAPPIPEDHDFFKAMPPHLGLDEYNDLRVRRACIPSANGHFTARALARMYGALANGGAIDGVRLVSQGGIRRMIQLETDATDRVLMMPIPKAAGFWLGGDWGTMPSTFGPRATAFGHPGAGGSVAYADPEIGLGVAVTLNRMQPSLLGEGTTADVCALIRETIESA